MRKFLLILVASVGLLTIAMPAWSYYQQDPIITTTGEAEVKIDPDYVIFNFGIEAKQPSMKSSKAKNDQLRNAVVKKLKELKIDSKDIQSSHISVSTNHRQEYDNDTRKYFEIKEFIVRRSIVITLRDLSKFETIITEGLDSGVTHVHGIQFRTSELRKYREEARETAIKAAKEKAEKLSAALGQKIGKATAIHSYNSGWYSWYGNSWGWGGGSSGLGSQYSISYSNVSSPSNDNPVSLGKISITASISVSFELVE